MLALSFENSTFMSVSVGMTLEADVAFPVELVLDAIPSILVSHSLFNFLADLKLTS